MTSTRQNPCRHGAAGTAIRSAAFTLIELLVVIAIVAILALMALPTYTDKIVREQVQEGLKLADIAKTYVQSAYVNKNPKWVLPANNADAGLPPPEKMVNNYVSAINVVDGVITVTFGNNSNPLVQGKKLTYRPLVTTPPLTIDWACHARKIPNGTEVKGKDETDLQRQFQPFECRTQNPQ